MRRERGFTLIELLMALVMTTLVAGSLYKLLLSNQRVYRHQTERVELQGNRRHHTGRHAHQLQGDAEPVFHLPATGECRCHWIGDALAKSQLRAPWDR